ncbi:MAG: AsmA-like C-terminal region-containing protein, partial [Deltaproteobacteria bacterium]
EIGDDATVTRFGGEILIGQGTFAPATGGGETVIEAGAATFSFDPKIGRVDFDRLALKTSDVDLDLRGHTLIETPVPGSWPTALIAQFDVAKGAYTNAKILSEPVSLTHGNADFRVTLNPFRVDIGQLRLSDGETAIVAHGSASAPITKGDAWIYQLSASLDVIATTKLARYWPLMVATNARNWYLANVSAGTIFDADFALSSDGGPPKRLLTWRMRDATVRYMETMTLLTEGFGYGMIEGNRFTVTAEGGKISGGEAGEIDVAGTTMLIEDTTIRPTPAIFKLVTTGDLAAALKIINTQPLGIMDRAGQPIDLASGLVRAETDVSTILKKGTPLGDINWKTRARMSGVQVPKLVPTGILRSDDLSLIASPELITISGPMTLDDVPLDATYTQTLGPAADNIARVAGTVTLGPEFVKEFAIGLPKNSVSGAASSDFTLTIAKDQDIRFTLNSALAGIGLRLDALNWSKPAKTTGSLTVDGRIAGLPVIDSLSFDAAGLQAKGSLSVAANGGLERAEFSSVKIGGWFNGPITMTGRGRDATPGIEVKGGTLDFRRADFGSGAASDGGPLKVSLDKLTIADSIAIQSFRGNFTSLASGLKGNFNGRLNGGGQIDGALAPSEKGTALVVTSDNAGEVFKDANLAQRVNGGAMELILTPTGEVGTYSGKLTARNVSVRGTPALAELLSAMSVVGLLQQLNGDGIQFENMEAQFTLTPSFIQFRKASAIGAAMGIAMDGAYTLGSGALNMRGTIA